MKQILLIGSTVADVIINVPRLPQTGDDVLLTNQSVHIGGCAYNVSNMLSHFRIPHTLCSPVGSGIYGDFIKNFFKKNNLSIFAEAEEENSCCYCLVDSNGERSFVCGHGAEYKFKRKYFNKIDVENTDSAYICGLELEEDTAGEEVSYIEELSELNNEAGRNFTVFFAPAPRINFINEKLLERIFKCKPVLHLNRTEAFEFTKQNDVYEAAKKLNSLTDNHVIITLGKDGAFYFDGKTKEYGTVPPVKTTVVDTIGAGDSHFAGIIASLKQGKDLCTAVKTANLVAAAVTGTKGSTLSDKDFLTLKQSGLQEFL